MIGTLEQRYDSYMAEWREGGAQDPDGDLDEAELPSADELAAEFERYLASRPRGDDDHGMS